MSDSIKSVFAASATQKTEPGRGAAYKQQWRLIFEKAYLALSRSGMADGQIRTESPTNVADRDKGAGFAAVAGAAESGVEPGTGAGVLAESQVQPAGPSGFALELADGRFEQRIAGLLNGNGMPATAPRRDSIAKASQPVQESPKAVYKDALPEKSLLLLPAMEGFELVIRDAAIGSDLLKRIILKVRDILDSRGIRLARVIVNGVEVWAEQPGDAGPDVERPAGLADWINRIY